MVGWGDCSDFWFRAKGLRSVSRNEWQQKTKQSSRKQRRSEMEHGKRTRRGHEEGGFWSVTGHTGRPRVDTRSPPATFTRVGGTTDCLGVATRRAIVAKAVRRIFKKPTMGSFSCVVVQTRPPLSPRRSDPSPRTCNSVIVSIICASFSRLPLNIVDVRWLGQRAWREVLARLRCRSSEQESATQKNV